MTLTIQVTAAKNGFYVEATLPGKPPVRAIAASPIELELELTEIAELIFPPSEETAGVEAEPSTSLA